MEPEAGAAHAVRCHACGTEFDALTAAWCSCLVSERTLVCPACSSCFCKATPAYKRQFWAGAPRALWQRKADDSRAIQDEAGIPANPDPEQVARPLVLLVEDERVILKIAARTIQSLGYGLVVARNGEEGLDLARRYRPELVLTDALMPKLDGREMALRIKSDAELAGTKVVVMTALYTSVKYQTEAYRSFKVDGYLSKPLHIEELVKVLEEHLG
jgi:CheY-like chemotaxis protein